MVAIYPQSKAGEAADTLRRPLESMNEATRGYLSAFIGLAFLRHADPVQALEWARIGGRLISSPLPLDVGELSLLFWQSREKRVETLLPFQDQFPELKEIETTFGEAENKAFLENARRRFEDDFKEGKLQYFLLDALKTTLLPNNPNDQEMLIRLGHTRVALDPSDMEGWKTLARAYEHTKNPRGLVSALEGLTAADPLNYNAKIDLAYASVLLGDFGKAESTLKATDPAQVKSNGDYLFCLGAVAEWKNKPERALEYYKEAIEKRRYKPVYHLHYGRLLMAEGRKEDAAKVLRWAAGIDAEGSVKKQAEQLLSQMAGLS
jgi:tetratricopeptide (TPR) repeat protein